MEKYGVEHASQNSEIQDKIKKNFIETIIIKQELFRHNSDTLTRRGIKDLSSIRS
jgi:hypothetical protein